MKRGVTVRVSKNALALLSAQVGARLLALLLSAQLTRTVGVAGLGRYLLAMTVEGIALAVADLGLNLFTVRALARAPEETEALLGTTLALKSGTALLGAALLNALVAPFFFPDRRMLLAVASLALLPDAVNSALSAWMKAQQRMEVSSGIDLGRRALAAAAGVALLWAGFDERAALLAYVVSGVLVLPVYGVLLHRQRVRPRFGALGRRWRSTLAGALPFAVTGVVALLYRRLDLLMLSAWRGDVSAGVYGAAYRLWETLGIVPSSLLDALFPELARRGSAATRQQLQPLIRRGRRWLLLLLLALIVPCWWLAPWLIDVLYGDVTGIAAAPGLFRLLLLALPFTYLYLLNGHVLYALGRQRRVSAWMVAVTALNAGLNALLIPRWGMWAAAGAALLSEVALFAALRGSVVMLSANHSEMDGAEV